MLIPWFRSLLVSTQTCWLPNIFLAICDLPLFFPRFHRQSMTLLATVTWVFAANVPCVESENSWGITPIAEASFLQRWLRERLLRYFSFKAIFEEKWGRESMASCCLGEVTFSSHDAHPTNVQGTLSVDMLTGAPAEGSTVHVGSDASWCDSLCKHLGPEMP